MWTFKGTLARMAAQMLLQIMVDFKDLRTLGTAKGTLTSMSAYMRQEM